MNILEHRKNELLENLVEVLDMRMLELEKILKRLDTLRASVIRRDQQTLMEILQQVRDESAQHQQNDQLLHRLAERLGQAFGIEPPVCISKLIPQTPFDWQLALKKKQQQLKQLAEKVQSAYTTTDLFLRQCILLNRQLLEAIGGQESSQVAYDAQGQSNWSIQRSLINFKS